MQIKKETHVNFIIYMLLKNQKQANLEFFPKILEYFWQKKLLSFQDEIPFSMYFSHPGDL